MKINPSELSKEQIEKALACKTAEELMELARREGVELTKDEAEAYLADLADFGLDGETLQRVAGGRCYEDRNTDCFFDKYKCLKGHD